MGRADGGRLDCAWLPGQASGALSRSEAIGAKKAPAQFHSPKELALALRFGEDEAQVNGRMVRMLKAGVERRYKDKDGSWKSSNSFSRNEIPLAIYCLQKAFEAIVEEQNVQPESKVGEEVVR